MTLATVTPLGSFVVRSSGDSACLMRMKSLSLQTLAGGLLLLSGCEVVHNARADLDRVSSSNPFVSHPKQSAGTPTRAAPVQSTKPGASNEAAVNQAAKSSPPAEKGLAAPANFIGKSEGELRAELGPPTTVEERPPGKVWHYRDGRCTLDIQLYPDVQTRQFGTLAYEVKSDDNTDEGNRACLGQLRSRAQSHG